MTTAIQSYSILLIEDNPGDELLIREMLQEKFTEPFIFVATTYKEGEAALESGQHDFDVILLDLTLPDKNGRSLIEAVLAHDQVCCPVGSPGTELEFAL